MPKIKLSKRVIEELEPMEKDQFYWDTGITGLALKVTPKGKKTFLVQYRPGGRGTPTRKMFIGPFDEVTFHKAQTEAKRILGLRAEGRDPALLDGRCIRREFRGWRRRPAWTCRHAGHP